MSIQVAALLESLIHIVFSQNLLSLLCFYILLNGTFYSQPNLTPSIADTEDPRSFLHYPNATRHQVPTSGLIKSGFAFVSFFLGGGVGAAPAAHGGSQARSLIGARAAGLHHRHSNAGSKTYRDLHLSSRQCWILNPLSEARDRTCVLMDPSQIHFCCAMMGTHAFVFNHHST